MPPIVPRPKHRNRPQFKMSHPELRLSMSAYGLKIVERDLLDSVKSGSGLIQAKLIIQPSNSQSKSRTIHIRVCDWLDWRQFIQIRSQKVQNLQKQLHRLQNLGNDLDEEILE